MVNLNDVQNCFKICSGRRILRVILHYSYVVVIHFEETLTGI